MKQHLTEAPGLLGRTFLNFPLELDLHNMQADIAVLGIPYGKPYDAASMANSQTIAPLHENHKRFMGDAATH